VFSVIRDASGSLKSAEAFQLLEAKPK